MYLVISATMAATVKPKRGPAQPKGTQEASRSAADLLAYYQQRTGTGSAEASRLSSSIGRSPYFEHLEPSTCTCLLAAEDFEVERQSLLDRVDTCAAQKSEQHKLEWENKRRAEEVRELQKARHQLSLCFTSRLREHTAQRSSA